MESENQDPLTRKRIQPEEEMGDDAIPAIAMERSISRCQMFGRVITGLKLHDFQQSGAKNRFPLAHFRFKGLLKSQRPKKFSYADLNGNNAEYRSFSFFALQRTKESRFVMGCISLPESWLGPTQPREFKDDTIGSQTTTSSSSSDSALHHRIEELPAGLYPLLGVSGLGKSILIFELMIRLQKWHGKAIVVFIDECQSSLMAMDIMLVLTTIAVEVCAAFPHFREECMTLYLSSNLQIGLNNLALLFEKIGGYCDWNKEEFFFVIDGIDGQHEDFGKVIDVMRNATSMYAKYVRIILVGCAFFRLPRYLCHAQMLEKELLCDAAFVASYYASLFSWTLAPAECEKVVEVTGGLIAGIAKLAVQIQDCNGVLEDAIAHYVSITRKEIESKQGEFWNSLKEYEAKMYWQSIIAMQYGLNSTVLQACILDARYMYKGANGEIKVVTWIAKDAIIHVAYLLNSNMYRVVLDTIAEHIFRHAGYFSHFVVGKFVELLIVKHIAHGHVFRVENLVSLKSRGSGKGKALSWSFSGACEISFGGLDPPKKTWDSQLQRLFFSPTTAPYPDMDCLFYSSKVAAIGGFPSGVTAVQISVTEPLTNHFNGFFKMSSRDHKVHAEKWRDLLNVEEQDVRMLFIGKEAPNIVSKDWLACDPSWKGFPQYYAVTFKDIATSNPQLQILNLLYMR